MQPTMPSPRLADQQEIINRIRRVMNEVADGRQALLAEMTRIQQSMLSKIFSEKAVVTDRHIAQIEAGTGVRATWLRSGIEPMYHPARQVPARSGVVGEGAQLRAYLQRNRIRATQLAERMDPPRTKSTVSGYWTVETFDPVTKDAILAALGADENAVFGGAVASVAGGVAEPAGHYLPIAPLDSEAVVTLPFVPLRARAGLPTARYWEHEPETTRIMRASLADYEPDPLNPRRRWWVIEVDGDSMEPRLNSRDRVLGYYVHKEQVVDLKPGVWAIQYDDEFVIKRVRTNTLERDGNLLLHSDNPPPDPFLIKSESIHHVWFIETIVTGSVR